MRNTTISGNSGGSLLTYGGQPYPTLLSNVTIADNTGAGGFEHDLSVPAEVRNTIIAGNSGAYGSQDVEGTFNSLGHNLIGVVSSAIGFNNGVNGDIIGTAGNPVSAGLLPLANNGGPTQTRALMATSLAIDAGDPVVFEPRTSAASRARPAPATSARTRPRSAHRSPAATPSRTRPASSAA